MGVSWMRGRETSRGGLAGRLGSIDVDAGSFREIEGSWGFLCTGCLRVHRIANSERVCDACVFEPLYDLSSIEGREAAAESLRDALARERKAWMRRAQAWGAATSAPIFVLVLIGLYALLDAIGGRVAREILFPRRARHYGYGPVAMIGLLVMLGVVGVFVFVADVLLDTKQERPREALAALERGTERLRHA